MTDPEPEPEDLSRRNVRLGAVVLLCLVGVVGLNMVRGSRSAGEAPKLSEALRASLERRGAPSTARKRGSFRRAPRAT